MSIGRSNRFLDDHEEIIAVPSLEDASYNRDPEEFLVRLAELETPKERLKTLVTTLFYFVEEPTHEALLIRRLGLVGFMGGFVLGGIIGGQGFTNEFIRNHNAAVFEGKHRAHRMYWDNMSTGLLRKGLHYGCKTGLLCSAAGFASFGSIAYRNKLYLPDWLVGFALIGGVSRLWLGSKAFVAGGIIGSCAGLIGFGLAKSFELVSGTSVSQMRYLYHTEWLKAREETRRSYLQTQDEVMKIQIHEE